MFGQRDPSLVSISENKPRYEFESNSVTQDYMVAQEMTKGDKGKLFILFVPFIYSLPAQ